MIVAEDDNILALNKPAFLSTLDERETEKISLLKLAKSYNPDVQVCHRLDKETSGIIIFSKYNDIYREISMKFEHRKISKAYHAISEGCHDFKNLEINKPISVNSKGFSKIDFGGGKESLSIFNTLKIYRHFTLIECKPVTGRLHQIRVHLKSANAPIAGDVRYGAQMPMLSALKRKFKLGKFEEEKPIINRVALHAFSISFELGVKKYHLEAAYPKDFKTFQTLLEKYDQI